MKRKQFSWEYIFNEFTSGNGGGIKIRAMRASVKVVYGRKRLFDSLSPTKKFCVFDRKKLNIPKAANPISVLLY